MLISCYGKAGRLPRFTSCAKRKKKKGGAATKQTEEQLGADLRAGRLARVYYLYGKEPFLVKTYFDRVIKKAVGEDALDFNLVRIGGNPDLSLLSDYIDGLPVFAERKVVAVSDLDPEKMDADSFSRLLGIVGDIPETSILLIGITGIAVDEKKAKTKKLIAAAEKNGTVCRFDFMQASKIAELVVKKAAKSGIVISREDARYLTERVLGNLTLISEETAKLISFVGTGNVIDRPTIDLLVAKQLDTSVYELAAAINAGKRSEAFRIIDDLIFQRVDPIVILSALSGAYLDFYRAKLAKAAGIPPSRAAQDFSYAKNREWVFSKATNAVARLNLGYLRETVEILSRADNLMKSAPIESRTVLEEAAVRLLDARERII